MFIALFNTLIWGNYIYIYINKKQHSVNTERRLKSKLAWPVRTKSIYELQNKNGTGAMTNCS